MKNLKKSSFGAIVTATAVCAAVAVCFVSSLTPVFTESNTQSNEPELISSLDSEQCVEKLLELGVSIPQELSGINIKELIASVETNPSFHPAVNYTVAYNFYEDVRQAVIRYHGWSDTESTASTPRYTLQYSTLDSWDPSTMPNYNCYAYAIGRSDACNPGDFSGQSYDHTSNILTVANIVKDDLQGQLKITVLRNKYQYRLQPLVGQI